MFAQDVSRPLRAILLALDVGVLYSNLGVKGLDAVIVHCKLSFVCDKSI